MIERLRGYRALCAEIRALEEQIDEVTAMAARCTQGWGTPVVSGSGYATSRVEAAAIRLVDIRRELEARVARVGEARRAIEAEIGAVPDPDARRLLGMRYLSGWSVERIAEELGVSVRWTQDAMRFAESKIAP